MTVAWKSPKHCGGSRVNAYYVDRRNADKLQWKEVNVSAIKERVYTVSLVGSGSGPAPGGPTGGLCVTQQLVGITGFDPQCL